MTWFERRVASIPWPLRSLLLATAGLLLVLGWHELPAVSAGGSVVSAGQSLNLRSQLRTDGDTLLAFYSAGSTLESEAIARLERHSALHGGTRRIALDHLGVPEARPFRVTATPTFLLYDRNGHLLLRSSRPEEVERMLDPHRSAVHTASPPVPRTCPLRHGPRLAWVAESSPAARRVYRRWGGGRQPVPDIYKAMSLRPDLMDRVADLTDRAHFSNGFLNRRTKELIATYVSSLNRCGYCLGSHAENLRGLGVSSHRVQAVARGDLKAAALTARERALLGLVKTLTLTPAAVTDEQIAQLRRLGWSDRQIFEAAFDTSLFAFFNRMADVYGLRYEPDL